MLNHVYARRRPAPDRKVVTTVLTILLNQRPCGLPAALEHVAVARGAFGRAAVAGTVVRPAQAAFAGAAAPQEQQQITAAVSAQWQGTSVIPAPIHAMTSTYANYISKTTAKGDGMATSLRGKASGVPPRGRPV
jgi:hypothetical protein